MVTRVQKVVVTAVLAVSAVVGLSGSTAGAWSSEDGAVAVWGGVTENDGSGVVWFNCGCVVDR